MLIDDGWLRRVVDSVSDEQLIFPGVAVIEHPVERISSLFEAWAMSFSVRRADVVSPAFVCGARGWHPDECASFIRALDAGQVHVDSAGYAVPLCAQPKPKQDPYSLCCKSGEGVTVNLEYLIQLGVVAELASQHGWPYDRLRVEIGEFDGGALDASGQQVVLMEAKCRARSRYRSDDTLEKLMSSWLGYARAAPPSRGENAANKYLYLLEEATDRPVTVLLAAAGARWWITATRNGDQLHFEESVPLRPEQTNRT